MRDAHRATRQKIEWMRLMLESRNQDLGEIKRLPFQRSEIQGELKISHRPMVQLRRDLTLASRFARARRIGWWNAIIIARRVLFTRTAARMMLNCHIAHKTIIRPTQAKHRARDNSQCDKR